MKRFALFIAAALLVCLPAVAQKTEAMKGKTLVVYFSATGNTERVAKMIATAAQADLYKIQPAKDYTSADLDWHNKSSRSSVEMNDAKARPELSGSVSNWADYTTVYLGYPIWWDQAPRIINSFIESYDFSGKVVIPFATSGSSSISHSAQELKKTYPSINWQKGKLLNGVTQTDISNWIQK